MHNKGLDLNIGVSVRSSSPFSSFSQTTQSLSPLTIKPLSRQQPGVDFRAGPSFLAGTFSVHGHVKLVPVWSVTGVAAVSSSWQHGDITFWVV